MMKQAKVSLILIMLFTTISCSSIRTQYVPATMNKVPRPARTPEFQDTDNSQHPGSWHNLKIMYNNHSKAVRHIELLNGVIDSYEFRIDSFKDPKDED